MFSLLRVDMASRACIFEEIPQAYSGMGGWGLAVSILTREVSPACVALSPLNKLVFAPGLLCDTLPLFKNRLAIGCKSPTTQGLKSATCSCLATTHLLRLGILGLIIENAAPHDIWLQLEIQKGQARLVPSPVAGLGIVDTMTTLHKNYGASYSCISIGPAGERSLLAANIAFTEPDGINVRHAGSEGMGAVMGSKRLRNIIILPGNNEAMTDVAPDAVTKAAKHFSFTLDRLVSGFRHEVPQKKNTHGEDAVSSVLLPAQAQAPDTCQLCGPICTLQQKKDRNTFSGYRSLWQASQNSAAAEELQKRFDAVCDDQGLDAFATSALLLKYIDAESPKSSESLTSKECSDAVLDVIAQFCTEIQDNSCTPALGDLAPKIQRAQTTGRKTSSDARTRRAFADAMGLCVFGVGRILDSSNARQALVSLLNARYGWSLPDEYVLHLGEHLIRLEENFNEQV